VSGGRSPGRLAFAKICRLTNEVEMRRSTLVCWLFVLLGFLGLLWVESMVFEGPPPLDSERGRELVHKFQCFYQQIDCESEVD